MAVAGLAWTSGAVVRDNLQHWAAQWASELNELGAPFYLNDAGAAMLDVERFIAKYPEIESVSWYGTDGRALLSLDGDGTTASSVRSARCRNRRGARGARRRGPALLAHAERLAGTAVSTVGTDLDGVVRRRRAVQRRSRGSRDLGTAARLRQRRPRLLGLRERPVAAVGDRERRAAAAARRIVGVRPLVLEERASPALGARALAGAARGRRAGRAFSDLALHGAAQRS